MILQYFYLQITEIQLSSTMPQTYLLKHKEFQNPVLMNADFSRIPLTYPSKDRKIAGTKVSI